MNTTQTFNLISAVDGFEVRMNTTTKQKGLFSLHKYCIGEKLVPFTAASIETSPNYLTVQINKNTHIHLNPTFLQFINHSCTPNVFFNTTTMQLECIQNIVPGAEIVFFYPSTEWEIASTFKCHCGSPECILEITGAANTPLDILSKYRLSDYINEMLLKKNSTV